METLDIIIVLVIIGGIGIAVYVAARHLQYLMDFEDSQTSIEPDQSEDIEKCPCDYPCNAYCYSRLAETIEETKIKINL